MPYPTQRDLFWAIWRVDMIATAASTAGGFLWIFGFTALIALAFVVAGLEIPEQVAGASWTVFLVVYLMGLFGGGFSLMYWCSRLAFRRFGLVCPSCGSRCDGFRKERKCLASGRCPACGTPVVVKSDDQTTAPGDPEAVDAR
jgi:hypothetical protein